MPLTAARKGNLMTTLRSDANTTDTDPDAVARHWLTSFENALTARSDDELSNLFELSAGWRDLVAFTWNLRQAHDNRAIADLLLAVVDDIAPTNFRIDDERPGPSVTSDSGQPTTVEVFFRFTTAAGEADGYAVLAVDEVNDTARARTLFTRLVSLHAASPVWPPTGRFDVQNPGTRWREYLQKRCEYTDHSPEVLIVGAGQFGLMTAAHLGRLGVDTLIVDKQAAVGDAWRTRYESLLLHQPNNMLHYSMMPYPESFPEYMPKDKMADWLETYASAFDLNIWTSTEFLGGTYDESEQEWTVSVRRGDGTVQELHPKHVLMATGGSDVPNTPEIEGLETFSGDKLHSSQFVDGRDFKDKNVLIIGAGTSAHDFAHDITRHGGSATMVQRGPLVVIDLPTANEMYKDYVTREVPVDLVDIRFQAGFVYHQLREGFISFQKYANEADSELHAGLQQAGMDIWAGQDDTGFYYTYLSKSKGGYYLNVGASDAIARGEIQVIRNKDLKKFDADGIILEDGTHQAFDAVVFATAYKPLEDGVRKLFGDDIADKLGQVWGFGNDGELNNVLKPTAQPGFWILEGSLPMARWHSPLMALLVKAEIDGIVPEAFKATEHPSRTPSEPVPALAPAFRSETDTRR